MSFRLLADENTSHRLVPGFPIIHIAKWQNGIWLGLDDTALLISCTEAKLVLVAFDRSTLAWHAGQLPRAGRDHSGVILFRGAVRNVDYGYQSRLLAAFWQNEEKPGIGRTELFICRNLSNSMPNVAGSTLFAYSPPS